MVEDISKWDYEIGEQLGEGSYGKTSLAERSDGLIFALKEPLDYKPDSVKAFNNEYEILASLGCDNPNVVCLLGYDPDDLLLALTYIPGMTITDLLDSDGPNLSYLNLFLILARAVKYLHDHNVVHRDLKIDNVIIKESGEPVIIDFGSASFINDKPSLKRLDIYFLGMILFKLLKGDDVPVVNLSPTEPFSPRLIKLVNEMLILDYPPSLEHVISELEAILGGS